MPTIQELQQLQELPIDIKVEKTKQRIREWVDHYGVDGVAVSFSGGKDSTVLLTLARSMYPEIKAVFFDTGLEYPEIREFVKTWDNVDWIRPKMNFRQTIEKYGYPMISKEVSEVVRGARKYLASVIEEKNASAAETDGMKMDNIELVEAEHIRHIKTGGKNHLYQFETSKILGTIDYYNELKRQKEQKEATLADTLENGYTQDIEGGAERIGIRN